MKQMSWIFFNFFLFCVKKYECQGSGAVNFDTPNSIDFWAFNWFRNNNQKQLRFYFFIFLSIELLL